jgi:hypothetical protein
VVQAQQPLHLCKEPTLQLPVLGLTKQLLPQVVPLLISKHSHALAHGLNPLALLLCVYALGVVVEAVGLDDIPLEEVAALF